MAEPLPGAVEADTVVDKPEGEVDFEKQAADLQAKLDDATAALDTQKTDSERNTRRLQSSLEGRINVANQERDEVNAGWERQYHSEKMAGMETEDAQAYEISILTERLTQKDTEMGQLRSATEQARSAAGWIQHFASLGVTADRINAQGSLQELVDSGYAAEREDAAARTVKMEEYATQVEQLTESVAALQAGDPDPNALARAQGDLEPDAVATQTPGVQPTTPRTPMEARQAAAKYYELPPNPDGSPGLPSMEMLYTAVERKQLPQNVLPELEDMPSEADVTS